MKKSSETSSVFILDIKEAVNKVVKYIYVITKHLSVIETMEARQALQLKQHCLEQANNIVFALAQKLLDERARVYTKKPSISYQEIVYRHLEACNQCLLHEQLQALGDFVDNGIVEIYHELASNFSQFAGEDKWMMFHLSKKANMFIIEKTQDYRIWYYHQFVDVEPELSEKEQINKVCLAPRRINTSVVENALHWTRWISAGSMAMTRKPPAPIINITSVTNSFRDKLDAFKNELSSNSLRRQLNEWELTMNNFVSNGDFDAVQEIYSAFNDWCAANS